MVVAMREIIDVTTAWFTVHEDTSSEAEDMTLSVTEDLTIAKPLRVINP